MRTKQTARVGRRHEMYSQLDRLTLNPHFREDLACLEPNGFHWVGGSADWCFLRPSSKNLSAPGRQLAGTLWSHQKFVKNYKLPAHTYPGFRSERYFWGNVLNFHAVGKREKSGWRREGECSKAERLCENCLTPSQRVADMLSRGKWEYQLSV